MQTTRQIERHWTSRHYDRLARELLAPRPENSPRLLAEVSHAVPAAALALIRLDELNQANHPLCGKLIRTIIAAQEGDGGWGDPLVSALCLRALMCNKGLGVAVHRGIAYLANLQKDEGAWPAGPIRRMSEDAYVTAFILYHLADQEPFRAAVRLDDAINWLTGHESAVRDDDTRRLTHRATLRARLRPTMSFVTAAN